MNRKKIGEKEEEIVVFSIERKEAKKKEKNVTGELTFKIELNESAFDFYMDHL